MLYPFITKVDFTDNIHQGQNRSHSKYFLDNIRGSNIHPISTLFIYLSLDPIISKKYLYITSDQLEFPLSHRQREWLYIDCLSGNYIQYHIYSLFKNHHILTPLLVIHTTMPPKNSLTGTKSRSRVHINLSTLTLTLRCGEPRAIIWFLIKFTNHHRRRAVNLLYIDVVNVEFSMVSNSLYPNFLGY
jgi:hypothetical protein